MNELLTSLRRRGGAIVIDNLFRGLSSAGQLHPLARPERHGVTITRDVPYLSDGRSDHLLDVYTPKSTSTEPLPIVVYVHGGGFRILSKDTHWVMGLSFARKGYLVFNVNYRLAPEHPFPAALEDLSHALAWIKANAARYGGDPSQVVYAGESAGANLVTSLAVASSWQRPEDYAKRIWDTDLPAKAIVPACGILQVSDGGRFARRRPMNPFLQDRITEVCDGYIGGYAPGDPRLAMADPLLILEQASAPERAFPATFAPVGTADALLDDTRRLKAALDKLEVPSQAAYYKGEVHAFHAFVWREKARQCWNDTFRFLDEHAPGAPMPTL